MSNHWKQSFAEEYDSSSNEFCPEKENDKVRWLWLGTLMKIIMMEVFRWDVFDLTRRRVDATQELECYIIP